MQEVPGPERFREKEVEREREREVGRYPLLGEVLSLDLLLCIRFVLAFFSRTRHCYCYSLSRPKRRNRDEIHIVGQT